MKNFKEILSDAGVELTKEQQTAVEKALGENYRTVADYNKAVEKRDEFKTSLDDVTKKLEEAQKNAEDADGFKTTIEQLKADLEKEKNDRALEENKRAVEGTVDTFLGATNEDGSKKYAFVNDITRKSIRDTLIAELEKDTAKGVGIADIFTRITTDEEGKALPNLLVTKAEANKPRFTSRSNQGGNGGGAETLKGMSIEERMKLKSENPQLYANMRQAEN